ncbi:MAG: sugar nucleotide-binding protein [Cycloclasticus sp.]
MAKILIIGCGDIGGAVASQLHDEGHQVTGLKRSLQDDLSGMSFIQADITKAEDRSNLPTDFEQVIYILSPSGGSITAYDAVFKVGVDNVLAWFKLQKENVAFTFVSSSRVYGQNKGEWLNESSTTEPTDERGKILLEAENKFLDFNKQTTIVRFSGIYGRSDYFINQLRKGADIQKEPPYYTNRIHRDDCIRALNFLINKKANRDVLQSIYLATDSDPASKWEVAAFLANTLSLPTQTAIYLEKNVDRNKRLENNQLLDEGFEFKFKSYKDGYNKFFDYKN